MPMHKYHMQTRYWNKHAAPGAELGGRLLVADCTSAQIIERSWSMSTNGGFSESAASLWAGGGGHGDRRRSHWWLRGKWPPYTPAASWTSSWAATTGHAASLSYAATRGRILGGRLISGLSRSPSACEMAGFGYTNEDANGYSTAEDNDWQGTLRHTAVATTNHMCMSCTTPTEGEQPVANDQLLLKWDTLKMA